MWAKLDDAILDNPKILAAGPLGFLLHVAAITWCARNLTDGLIPKVKVRTLVCLDGIGTSEAGPPAVEEQTFVPLDADEIAHMLARLGLWHDRGTWWELHDYLVYNPSRERVLATRQSQAQRQKKYRETHSDAASNASHNGAVTPAPVPVPVPEKKNKKIGLGATRRRASVLPDDFPFTEERRKFAEAGGVPDPGLEFAQFKDHHRAKGSLMYDWEAAWKTWCRNSVKFAAQRTVRR